MIEKRLSCDIMPGTQFPNEQKTTPKINESTAGADASVEVPKLHNIKLLIASFYTHIDYNYHDEHF